MCQIAKHVKSLIIIKLIGFPSVFHKFRSKTENKVDAIARIFETKDVLRLSLSPEGTRKKVTQWKSGYYYIAQKANLPIIPIGFDYANKQVIVFEPFSTTNDYEKDAEFLQNLFKEVKGKVAENSFS